MKVLVIGRFNSIHMRRFCEGLDQHGIDVFAFWYFKKTEDCPKTNYYIPERTTRILGIPRTVSLACTVKLIKIICKFKPCIIHVQDDIFTLSLLKWIRGKFKVAFTSWSHYEKELLESRKFKTSMARCSLLCSDAPDCLKELTTAAPKANKILIRFGADLDMFRPGPPLSNISARLGLAISDIVILSPRSLRENYNQIHLVRALPKILLDLPKAKIILKNHHTKNYPDSVEYEAMIFSEAKQLGVQDHLIRIDDVSLPELADLYRIATVAVSIPSVDAFAVTIFESMATGCPLVCGRDESYEGVIKDGINSLVVDQRNPSSIASAIVKVCIDSALARRLVVNGLQTVQEFGNFQTEIKKQIASYKRILDE